MLTALTVAATILPLYGQSKPGLELGFRRMYELKFDEARAEIRTYIKEHPEDPLGVAAEAASYLFEEFDRKGVLTSAFFLDDDRLLGGVLGAPDAKLRAHFLEANQRARKMAERYLKENPKDANSLFVMSLTYGMEADFEALIEKHQLASMVLIRRAENAAVSLLKIKPEALDAFLPIGAANYIVGCLPAYKRAFLWVGGVRGNRQRGMEQLEKAATQGHYLRPLAKVLLALASKREKQFERARSLFEDLHREFPDNPVFTRELALATRDISPAANPANRQQPK